MAGPSAEVLVLYGASSSSQGRQERFENKAARTLSEVSQAQTKARQKSASILLFLPYQGQFCVHDRVLKFRDMRV